MGIEVVCTMRKTLVKEKAVVERHLDEIATRILKHKRWRGQDRPGQGQPHGAPGPLPGPPHRSAPLTRWAGTESGDGCDLCVCCGACPRRASEP